MVLNYSDHFLQNKIVLKKRIIGVVIVRNGIAVQSNCFRSYLPIGKPEIVVEFLNDWGVDEIILLDISASRNQKGPNYSMVSKAAEKCLVPLTVGGGITSTQEIHNLMQCGADKISLNQVTFNHLDLIQEGAQIFGEQCIVVSVDIKKIEGTYKIYNYMRKDVIPNNPLSFIKSLEDRGAGEIFINNVDADGKKEGFDINLISYISKNISIPLICCGGAGRAQDFIEVLKYTEASGIAASNFFNFFEHSVTIIKSITNKDYPIRHDSPNQYNDVNLCELGRLKKKSDLILEDMLYQKIEKEVI